MVNETPFEPTWESLAAYRVPEWFKDAKLGIFIHWGPYAVPAFHNEWYPRRMYERDSPVFEHHRKTWGPQKRFGYKDFIPQFTAERWEPDAWVDLFGRTGARYVVPVAEHHDGFPMYGTKRTRWNAARMGPRRDVIAELRAATHAAGMKFGVSSHRAYNWRYYTFDPEFDTADPANAGLYGAAHPADAPADAEFLADWYGRTVELIDRFQPDLLYFDFCWEFEEFAPYRPRVLAYYYNRAREWGREVVLNDKGSLPPGTAVFDIECGTPGGMRSDYWQTDTTLGAWSFGYVQGEGMKSAGRLVHDLVDIVSKNGNLLLNVGPRADGTIPEEAIESLEGLGAWLRINGEAIYETRAWRIHGEGDEDGMEVRREGDYVPLTTRDIRFTSRGETLYAICPGWPGLDLTIQSLGTTSLRPGEHISDVRMVGTGQPLPFRHSPEALHVLMPATAPCEHACVVKMRLRSRVYERAGDRVSTEAVTEWRGCGALSEPSER